MNLLFTFREYGLGSHLHNPAKQLACAGKY